MRRPPKKRRYSQLDTQERTSEEGKLINSLKELQESLAEYNSAGLKRFSNFLDSCTIGRGVEETLASKNRGILKEYLKVQCRYATSDDQDGGITDSFPEFMQIWAHAFQNRSQHLMTMVPATLAILVRLCSNNEELKSFGIVLVREILGQSALKIIYRSLTGGKDYHCSPCLRLLIEMIRFDFGAMCGSVHSVFDFTIKGLVKIFEMRNPSSVEIEDPNKPSVRTLAVRFYMIFLQNGSPTVRGEMLGLRTWISAIFKHIRHDVGSLICEFLECMSRRVLFDKEISRAIKAKVFNEWVLGNILSVASRDEVVKVHCAGKEERSLADVVYNFLVETCTTQGNGVCFPDRGWFPLGYASESEGKHRGQLKVYNRALSSFASSVRPHADTLQLNLLLAMLKASPELVAHYFLTNTGFGFDPKPTSTWIGYCTFLTDAISLPVPSDFGASGYLTDPPPVEVILENIVPRPFSRVVATKCLTHENKLVRYLGTRLLVVSFQKLKKVLEAMDSVGAKAGGPQESWTRCRLNVLEGFCMRIPDVATLSGRLGAIRSGSGKNDVLLNEAQSRLCAEYYTSVPETALAGNFDINLALSSFADGYPEESKKRGFYLFQLNQFLSVAREIPGVRWWSKSSSMKHSPFLSVVGLCCCGDGDGDGISIASAAAAQVRELLRAFTSRSYLFQLETSIATLDALIDSLSSVNDKTSLEPILDLLDQVISRCEISPFKYLDRFMELAFSLCIEKEGMAPVYVAPVSPIVIALAEQWCFFIKREDISSTQKYGGAVWLVRFLDSAMICGENRTIIGELCNQMVAGTADTKAKSILCELKRLICKDTTTHLTSGTIEGIRLVGGRSILVGNLCLDSEVYSSTLSILRKRTSELSIFQLAGFQQAIVDMSWCASRDLGRLRKTMSIASELVGSGFALLGAKNGTATRGCRQFASSICLSLKKSAEALISARRLPILLELFHHTCKILCLVFGGQNPDIDEIQEPLVVLMGVILNNIQEADEQEVQRFASGCELMLSFNFNEKYLNKIILNLTSAPTIGQQRFISYILRHLAQRQETLDVLALNKILGFPFISNELIIGLSAYIDAAPSTKLAGISLEPGSEERHSSAIECSLVRKLGAFRERAIQIYDTPGGALPLDFPSRFAALIKPSAESNSSGFVWNGATSSETQKSLERIFTRALPQFIRSPLDLGQVDIFHRAVSLFPLADRSTILSHVLKTSQKSTLTEKTVGLVGRLLDEYGDVFSSEAKAWLLLGFDHLTRRFSEDDTLTEPLLCFSNEFTKFIENHKIPVDKLVPRASINAALEAAIQNHAHNAEVLHLCVALVSLSSPKFLDLPKFLQLLLGRAANPLKLRDTNPSPKRTQLHYAYLVNKIFWANPRSTSNLATLERVIELYHGSCDTIDRLLLPIIECIESHLVQSLANHITTWSVSESSDPAHPLIARTRGRISAVISGRQIQKSVLVLSPELPKLTILALSLSEYLGGSYERDDSLAYDPHFTLPAFLYCLTASTPPVLDANTAVNRHCAAYAIVCLSSRSAQVRNMAVLFLKSVAARLERASNKTRTQLLHHISSLLASLPKNRPPIPTVISVFHAQFLAALSNPSHFLYAKLNLHLLRDPYQILDDLPLLISPFHFTYVDTSAEEPDSASKTIIWVLEILVAGIKTMRDLDIYRRRSVFTGAMTWYLSPGMSERAKDKVLELLWRTAAVGDGEGATILITRAGVVTWIEQMTAVEPSEERKLLLKRLAARTLWASKKKRINEWSRGEVIGRFGMFGILGVLDGKVD